MAAPARALSRPSAEDLHRVIASVFDEAFYRAVYDDLPAEIDALWHYRVQGWREGRDPAPWFSTRSYTFENPDVKRLRLEPLFHYLTRGRDEGREVAPSINARAYYSAVAWSPQPWRPPSFGPAFESRVSAISEAESDAAIAREFDAAFYLAANPDVAASGMDPLVHFRRTGWLEGRDPTPGFSVRDYLDANPDIAVSGLNPFAHYVIAGRAEGRSPRHDLGPEFDVISRLRPVADRIDRAVRVGANLSTDPAERLIAALMALRPDLHITFSHDNYVEHSGGLQLCVRRESVRFAQLGRDHMHLYPAAWWPTVRRDGEPGALGVMLNGVNLGVFEPHAIRMALGRLPPGGRRSFAIHSLLGHAPDETADILEAAGLREGFFWLHDFASLCAGFHLQRNDVTDCGAPAPDSAACGVCLYGDQRARHTEAHRRLFERLSLTVAAPSQNTLDFWRTRTTITPPRAVVLPLARLVSAGPAPAIPGDRPLRVAFVGMPVPLKGWPVFSALARSFASDPRYAFLHLGGRPDPATPAAFHRVMATMERPQAMQDAVEALEIDVALIWPACRETFSFTAYEAAAGGAMVVTGPDSGNVASFAAQRGRGLVLDGEAALSHAFSTGEILSLHRHRRKPRRYRLAYSGMTGDLVGAGS
ncbi:hypothetical protein [Phenylobacterium sp.]|jgi:hypothetical protein|uniref:hypothetical protein n=1 Tax=Phenylobacterium sp. TaxID=1871053 RepID=UPI0037C8D7C0